MSSSSRFSMVPSAFLKVVLVKRDTASCDWNIFSFSIMFEAISLTSMQWVKEAFLVFH